MRLVRWMILLAALALAPAAMAATLAGHVRVTTLSTMLAD